MLRLMQPQPAFDTHTFVKNLTGAGMPEDQAEILAKGQSDLYERLVTQEYLEQKLGTLELTLRNELEKLRAELEQKFNQQEAALREMEYKLTIRLGAMLTIGITILGALFTLLTTAAS